MPIYAFYTFASKWWSKAWAYYFNCFEITCKLEYPITTYNIALHHPTKHNAIIVAVCNNWTIMRAEEVRLLCNVMLFILHFIFIKKKCMYVEETHPRHWKVCSYAELNLSHFVHHEHHMLQREKRYIKTADKWNKKFQSSADYCQHILLCAVIVIASLVD